MKLAAVLSCLAGGSLAAAGALSPANKVRHLVGDTSFSCPLLAPLHWDCGLISSDPNALDLTTRRLRGDSIRCTIVLPRLVALLDVAARSQHAT
jgi:hypothetical protein